MKSIKYIALSAFVTISTFCAVLYTSCNKDKCTAGTGGNVTIVAYPQHHTKPIINKSWYVDTVYIKYNTLNSPGAGLTSYDSYVAGEAGEDHVHLENLRCGDYYLYAVGFDTTISQRVTGGIPFSFTQTSGEVIVNIPVTE